MQKGQCHCGAVRFEIQGEPIHRALCHCGDCRRHSGAPMVAWALVPKNAFAIEGQVATYASSEHGRRQFCPECGTALFYLNDLVFPDGIDVQIATLDDPDAFSPQAHIQVAERIGWMETAHELPKFDRFPGE